VIPKYDSDDNYNNNNTSHLKIITNSESVCKHRTSLVRGFHSLDMSSTWRGWSQCCELVILPLSILDLRIDTWLRVSASDFCSRTNLWTSSRPAQSLCV